ncbi:MAG: BLUF domain-containing protein [Pseudomonadota bacterium]
MAKTCYQSDLETVVYVSRATRPMAPPALFDLLSVARERNLAADITGVLLHADGVFLQAMEGTAAALDATFARVSRDARHGDLSVLLRRAAPGRRFPERRLARLCPETSCADLRDRLTALLETTPTDDLGEQVLARLAQVFPPAIGASGYAYAQPSVSMRPFRDERTSGVEPMAATL